MDIKELFNTPMNDGMLSEEQRDKISGIKKLLRSDIEKARQGLVPKKVYAVEKLTLSEWLAKQIYNI